MLVSYGSKTEWSPIRSVIIRVHSEFTQQDGRKKRTSYNTLECDERDRAITFAFCRDLQLH